MYIRSLRGWRSLALSAVALLGTAVTCFGGASTNHPECEPLESYQAAYVQSTYTRERHMGFYFELAFRDLYPAPPHSDCQCTSKYAVSDAEYDEVFKFVVIEYGVIIPTVSTIRMCETVNHSLVVDQIITTENVSGVNVPVQFGRPTVFHTTIIAFEESLDPDDEQYEWVVEFSCGQTGSAILALGFPGGFVGLNFYSKSAPNTNQSASNLNAMVLAVESLGLDWAMDPEPWKGLDTGFNIVLHNQSICTY